MLIYCWLQEAQEAQAGSLSEQWDFMDSLAAATDPTPRLQQLQSPTSNGQHSSGVLLPPAASEQDWAS